MSESSDTVTRDIHVDCGNSSNNSGEETERPHSGDARDFNGEVPIMSPVQGRLHAVKLNILGLIPSRFRREKCHRMHQSCDF